MSEANVKAKWAVAVSALQTEGRILVHEPAVVEAGCYDEALGKAHRIAQALWPQDEGWVNHTAGVCPVDEVSDPEDADDESTLLGRLRLSHRRPDVTDPILELSRRAIELATLVASRQEKP